MIKSPLYDTAHNPYAGCTICHQQNGPYISPGAFGDETGNKIYYCRRCVTALAESFGLPTDHDVRLLTELVEEKDQELADALRQLDEARRKTRDVAADIAAELGPRLAEVISLDAERAKRRTVKTA